VAEEVARELGAPLDVFLVRKLGAPGQPELAVGAIATGGVRVLNREVVEAFGLSEEEIEALARPEEAELRRRERAYRGDARPPDVAGRTCILVDDGLATGATMRAAVRALREQSLARIVVAVPTSPPETCRALAREADEAVCLLTPEPFRAVGQWYEDFRQLTDGEVRLILDRAGRGAGQPRARAGGRERG
jgi:predicted phosphoribosyltransferase